MPHSVYAMRQFAVNLPRPLGLGRPGVCGYRGGLYQGCVAIGFGGRSMSSGGTRGVWWMVPRVGGRGWVSESFQPLGPNLNLPLLSLYTFLRYDG